MTWTDIWTGVQHCNAVSLVIYSIIRTGKFGTTGILHSHLDMMSMLQISTYLVTIHWIFWSEFVLTITDYYFFFFLHQLDQKVWADWSVWNFTEKSLMLLQYFWKFSYRMFYLFICFLNKSKEHLKHTWVLFYVWWALLNWHGWIATMGYYIVI